MDMMAADVSTADVLVLASLCWDETTKTKVAQKLSRELPTSCVVVDYTSDTFAEERLQQKLPPPTAATTGGCFDLVNILDNALFQYVLAAYPSSPLSVICPATASRQSFNLDAILLGKTSWADDQKLYVYTCSEGR